MFSNDHAMLLVVCHFSLMREAVVFNKGYNDFGIGQMYIALEMYDFSAGLARCRLGGAVIFCRCYLRFTTAVQGSSI